MNKGYLLIASTKEVGTIYFALRVVEDLFPETDSAPMAGELAKTISDRANGTDEEVHKPDYSYESDLMKWCKKALDGWNGVITNTITDEGIRLNKIGAEQLRDDLHEIWKALRELETSPENEES